MTMTSPPKKSESCVWNAIRDEAAQRAASEPMLASFLHANRSEPRADGRCGQLSSRWQTGLEHAQRDAIARDHAGGDELRPGDHRSHLRGHPGGPNATQPSSAASCRFCSSREFTRCRRIESPTGCGNRNANYSLFSCRIEFLKSSGSTFIRRHASAVESSWTMPRRSSSAKQR